MVMSKCAEQRTSPYTQADGLNLCRRTLLVKLTPLFLRKGAAANGCGWSASGAGFEPATIVLELHDAIRLRTDVICGVLS